MQVHIVAKDKDSLPKLKLQAELFDASSGEPAAPSQTVGLPSSAAWHPQYMQEAGCRHE